MIWVACTLAILLALPALAAQADVDYLNIYEENRQRVAQAMVENAMDAFELDKEGAISMMLNPDNPLFHDGNVHAFLVDSEGTFVTYAAMPDLIGVSIHNITDAAGTSMGDMFQSSSTPYGGWALYEGDPDWGWAGPIKAWLVTGWGYTFGAAIHLDANPGTDIYLTERDRERRDMAQAMVEQAIETFSLYPDIAISMIHDPDNMLFHDAELFTAIIHSNNTVIAHGDSPRLAGTDMETIEDTSGANLWDILEENSSVYGRWVEYYWPDPRTTSDDGEMKLTWVKTSGDHMFAAGIYPEDPDIDHDDRLSHHDASRKDTATQMMEQVTRMFAHDPERTISLIHGGGSLLFHDAGIYPIVVDHNGVVVAHGSDPNIAGTSADMISYVDSTLGDVLVYGSPYGNWVKHGALHPTSHEYILQNTLVKYHGGHTFAVGTYPQYVVDLYPDLTIAERERMAAAQNMVEQAAESFVDDPGATISAIHSISDHLFRDKELFVTIIHRNGTVVAHGYDPEIVGTDIEYLRDSRGTNIGDILERNTSVYGRWVEYHWPHPVSASENEPTLVWYKLFGEHMFSAGTYPESIT